MKATRLVKRLLLLAPLLASTVVAPMVATSPASAQNTATFVLQHVPDGTTARWEVRVEINPLGGCRPRDFVYTPTWIAEGSLYAARVSDDCRYGLTMEAREVGNSNRGICLVEWAWGANNANPGALTFSTDMLQIGDISSLAERLFVRHEGGSNPSCAAVQSSRFRIVGQDVVTALPTHSADSALTVRAVRAAALTEFSVLVEPDYDSPSAIPPGCHAAETIKVKGDGSDRRLAMAAATPAGVACTYRAKVTAAPSPFKIVSTSPVSFVAGVLVNLSSKVALPLARIAIIQQVSGSNNEGVVSYKITRSCSSGFDLPIVIGGTSGVYRLPGGLTVAELREGRYTVHYPGAPHFGPAYTYPVAASSDTSNIIAGCSVSTAISEVPSNCSVAGPLTQTKTWSTSRPIETYDFEFRLTCRPAVTPTTTSTTSVTTTTVAAPPTTTIIAGGCTGDARGENCMSAVDQPVTPPQASTVTTATAVPPPRIPDVPTG